MLLHGRERGRCDIEKMLLLHGGERERALMSLRGVVQAVVERERTNVIKKNEALQQSKDNLDKVGTTHKAYSDTQSTQSTQAEQAKAPIASLMGT